MPASPMISPERLPAASAEEWVPFSVLAAPGAALDSAAWMAAPCDATLGSSSRKGMDDCYDDMRLASRQLDGFLMGRLGGGDAASASTRCEQVILASYVLRDVDLSSSGFPSESWINTPWGLVVCGQALYVF